ncbi:hypothetical protein [Gelidibacter algens]|uniref:hypothetical protein n=1 Tax=Gelidibacter algens TaxID=49280 RepID=UPI000AB84BB4|nr:hypothetical protein [Gelidibacter algens]
MKKLFLFTMPLLCLFVLTFTSCNNDDDAPTDPIGQLPPMTQTGENTFGCLINGEPLIVSNTIELTAIYQGGVLQLGGGFENNITDKDITINIEEPLNINVPYDLTNYPVYIAKFTKN